MSSEFQTPTGCDALTTVEEDENIRRVFGDAKTIAEFSKQNCRRQLEPVLMSVPKGEEVLRHILRYHDPWPDWVLRVAVEVWSVHLPTIKKEVIYDSFRLVHFFVFEMRLDGSTSPEFPKLPEINARVLGAIIGHLSVMPDYVRSLADEALKIGALSSEKYAKYMAEYSSENFQRKLQPHLNKYFKARPSKWLEVCEAMGEAKRKTLDERGELRETTLTKVYSAILQDWVEIEELSGPTELCVFLKSVLVGNEKSPEKRLARVKKICQRMGIKFKPLVKGQTHPLPCPLPPAD